MPAQQLNQKIEVFFGRRRAVRGAWHLASIPHAHTNSISIMVHIPEYSLVIRPPQHIIDHVAVLKNRLKEHIGWFGSANAQAHITVFNFDATETELETWKKKIQQYCDTAIPHEVAFEHFDSFPPRTFFFAPDDASADYFNDTIINFQRSIGVKPQAHAHMSLARSLDAERLEQVKKIFANQNVDLRFRCDSFTLRKFNQQDKQYSDIVATFKFAGKPIPDLFSEY